MSTALPQELLDAIADELGFEQTRQSKQALASCILVSRSFRDRAVTWIFKCVNFFPSSQQVEVKRFAALRRVIAPTPNSKLAHAGRYIKNINFAFIFSGTHPLVHGYIKELIDHNIPAILDGIHGEDYGPESLSFQGGLQGTDYQIDWRECTANFTRVFSRILSSTSLKSLQLSCFQNFPIGLLEGTNINDLYLDDVQFSDFSPIKGGSSLSKPTIRSLHCVLWRPSLGLHFVSASHFRALERVNVECIGSEVYVDALKVLSMASESLVHFRMHTEGFNKSKVLNNRFNLGIFARLTSLELVHRLHTEPVRLPVDGEHFVSVFTTILHALSPILLLSKIALQIGLTLIISTEDVGATARPTESNRYADILDPEENSEVSRLDRMLSGPMFPSLSHVELLVKFNFSFLSDAGRSFSPQMFNPSIAASRLRERFPCLSASNQVAFTVEVRCPQ